MSETAKKWCYGISYLFSILLANLLVIYFGIIHIGWLVFPAGAAVVGLTFSLRDFVQRYWSHSVLYFMAASTVITGLLNWHIAVASVAAFAISELADYLIFTFFTKDFIYRIIVSNLISTPLDSLVFVALAFGLQSYDPVIGQTIVKFLFSLIVIPFIIFIRKNKNELE